MVRLNMRVKRNFLLHKNYKQKGNANGTTTTTTRTIINYGFNT